MGSLNNLFSSEKTNVEIGKIETFKGGYDYDVLISGVLKKAYNTLGVILKKGTKVVLNKTSSGKLYIIGDSGVSGNKTVKEIFRDG